jgi:hypothetical protein
MKAERSKLARLVIAYYEKFGRHVPESALRRVDAKALAARLQHALTTNMPLAETAWGQTSVLQFSPRGCCIIRDVNPEGTTPRKRPDGEWLQ